MIILLDLNQSYRKIWRKKKGTQSRHAAAQHSQRGGRPDSRLAVIVFPAAGAASNGDDVACHTDVVAAVAACFG